MNWFCSVPLAAYILEVWLMFRLSKASPDIGTFEVRVKEEVKVEGGVLAGVVHPDVQVQLLPTQRTVIFAC